MRLSRAGLLAAVVCAFAVVAFDIRSGRFEHRMAEADEAASIATVTQLAATTGAAPADVYEAIKRRCAVFNFERCLDEEVRRLSPWTFRWAYVRAGALAGLLSFLCGVVGYVLTALAVALRQRADSDA